MDKNKEISNICKDCGTKNACICSGSLMFSPPKSELERLMNRSVVHNQFVSISATDEKIKHIKYMITEIK